MNPERRKRIEDLFEAALDVPASRRAAFLDTECGGDADLRDAVDRLLRASGHTGGILDTSPVGEGPGRLSRTHPDTDAWIGPYRVLDELGRGGMGVVYLAERADGQFRRRVAIKVIRGADSPDLLARVVAERQILASLDHEDIARLLDGGVTDDGRPYLVMEHVPGLPIDLYCDRVRLTVRDRMRLFVRVARAVQHAHNNLVVHRDLKPSNILVTSDGRVKLLDFGIAKLLNPALAGVDQPVTRTDGRILTPAYASPEQLRGEPLTTSSDVYSLGVILYRLLTGRPPHEVPGGSASAALLAILEKDPDRPSARCTGDDAAERAAARSATPERLARTLRGDLDAIALKALRTEPLRRYGSAEALALDVERWLAGDPVAAHRGSRWYRVRKAAARHKAAAAAVVGVSASLVLGAGTATWHAGVAGRERDRAEAARVESEEVTDFLVELFRSTDPYDRGAGSSARDLLWQGLAQAEALAGQPRVQGRVLDVVGGLHLRLGDYDRARSLLERAVGVRRAALGPDDPAVAESLLNLAQAYRRLGQPAEARKVVEQAVAIRGRAFGETHPDFADAVFALGSLTSGEEQERLYRRAIGIHTAAGGDADRISDMLGSLGTNLRRQDRMAAADSAFRAGLSVAEAGLGPDHPQVATALFHLGDLTRDHHRDAPEAERLFLRGIAILTARYGERSLHLEHGLHSLSYLYSRMGRHDEAVSLYRRALETRRSVVSDEDPALAFQMNGLSGVLLRAGRLEEAEALQREAIDHHARLAGPRHPAAGALHNVLGGILAARGQWRESEAAYTEALAIRRASAGESAVVGETLRGMGRMLTAAGELQRAEAALLESLDVLRAVYTEEHGNVIETRRALHALYTAWNRPGQAALHDVPPGEFTAY